MNPFPRLALYWAMVRYANTHNDDFAKENYDFFHRMSGELASYTGDLKEKCILDLGCGKSAWLTLLLHSYGARTTGVDTEFTEPGRKPGKYLHIFKENGLERTARTLVWDYIYARPYYKALDERCPFSLNFDGVDLRRMTGTTLALPDNEFDVVVSHEVFEHLPDVPAAVRELHRVMKPAGITYIYVHNYTSISGGHHIAWKYPESEPSEEVPPWDHLRQNLYPDIPSWINRLRMQEYRAAFETCFDVQAWISYAVEGKELLTPAIREELSEYADEELLTKGFVIIARK